MTIKKSLAPTEEDFMNSWHQMEQYREQINHMLEPGLDAIRSFHYPRGGAQVFLYSFEVYAHSNKPTEVAYTVEHTIYGDSSTTTFTIPLVSILAGGAAVIAFFEEERAKQEEKANEMGRQHELKDKEERQQLFNKLKLEFEPPAEAIIKYDNN